MWATLPHPSKIISGLCAQLRHSCYVTPPVLTPLEHPIPIVSVWNLTLPLPISALYVGAGCREKGLRPSPWLNPFSRGVYPSWFALQWYEAYIWARPDYTYVLSFLSSLSTLVCDCTMSSTSGCYCHASFLSKCLVSDCSTCMECEPDAYHVLGPLIGDEDVAICPRESSWDMNASLSAVNETLRGSPTPACVDRSVGYCPAWDVLISAIRACPVRLFWEIFSGVGILTQKMREEGWHCAPPLDVLEDESFNLLNPLFVAIVLGLVLEGRFALIHLGPPCSSFSMAVNRFWSHAMRSVDWPLGFPGLSLHKQKKVDLGNSLAAVALRLMQAQDKVGHAWQLEQPSTSLMVYLPDFAAFLGRTGVFHAIAWVCAFGAPWAKPTSVYSNRSYVMDINIGCPGCPFHQKLEGTAPDGRNWTAIAGPYWPAFAQAWAKCWAPLLDSVLSQKCQHIAGWIPIGHLSSVQDSLSTSGFQPGGHRSLDVIAKRVFAGVQPTRRALPTLLPEGLGPDTHLELALQVPHPYTLPAPLSEPCQYAFRGQAALGSYVNEFRNTVCDLIQELSDACSRIDPLDLSWIHPILVSVIKDRNCSFIREISWITCVPDLNFLPHYLFGFDVHGWAMHDPLATPRMVTPVYPPDTILNDVGTHNSRILARCKSSGDPSLDAASWAKSSDEFKSGSLKGPYYSFAELPFPAEMFRLLLRFPIWEQHGGATEPTCRNIDNGLQGGQNNFLGMQYTTRPADIDSIIALVRSLMELFPDTYLRGFTSDFKSAYRQATANPLHAHLWILAIYDPVKGCPCFAVAAAQLFGCSAAPLNFCRIPGWCSFVTSRLFCLAFVSCIDDMITVECDSHADVAYKAWRLFASLCGWNIPDEKSPPPTQSFRALGAMISLASSSCTDSFVTITPDRAEKLVKIFNDILKAGHLAPAYAGSIFGQLGFTCTQFHGKWGRAKLRPFVRRQYEVDQYALNPQLLSAISWWLSNIPRAPSRQVFVNNSSRHVVISYSDGEPPFNNKSINNKKCKW